MTSPPRLYDINSFVDGEAMNPVKWYARVSRVLNYLLALLGTGAQARFTAQLTASQVIAANTNISYDTQGTIVEDTNNGWSPSTDVYICQSAGTYLFAVGMCCSAAAQPNPQVFKNGSMIIDASTPTSTSGNGRAITGYLRLGVGDTVSVRTPLGYTVVTTPNIRNYLMLAQISYN